MERIVAMKKLAKILGKSLGYRVNTKAPSQEERASAQEQLPAAIKERNRLKEKRDALYRALLENEEYEKARAAYTAAREHVDKLSSITRHYKFTVGTTNGMFFSVKAEGDSWEEVINKLQKTHAHFVS